MFFSDFWRKIDFKKGVNNQWMDKGKANDLDKKQKDGEYWINKRKSSRSDVGTALNSWDWDSASSLILSFFMDLSSFVKPSFEILLSINIDIDIVVKVACNQCVDDYSDEKRDSRRAMVMDLNDHALRFEEDQ